MSMRRAAIATAAIQTNNLVKKLEANKTEPIRRAPSGGGEGEYEENHIDLLFTGIILGIIFIILLLICHYCYRHFKKQPELIYRQRYFGENGLSDNQTSDNQTQGTNNNLGMDTNRAELITPEYYKTTSGPPPPYELVVHNWPDKSLEHNCPINMDAPPPPWKQAWTIVEEPGKQEDLSARPVYPINDDVEENEAGAQGGGTNEEQASGEEKSNTPGTVEKLKEDLKRDGTDSTGLPSYEATMKLETTGYF